MASLLSLSLQLRITVWSLCTKAVSYIKYPKACQKGECVALRLFCVGFLPAAPVDRCGGPSATACPMNHVVFSPPAWGPCLDGPFCGPHC